MLSRPGRPLRFIQIGDLHITAPGRPNIRDLGAIIDEINAHCTGAIDFVYLPGDLAENGASAQYALIHEQLARLSAPWRAIPGDHDFEPRALDAFYDTLACQWLPMAEIVQGCACLYLDSVSNGTGGPDFKLGPQQIQWLRAELADADKAGRSAAIFMHTYPADFGAEADELAGLIDHSSAVVVAMGHTHYNELAHDGRTIYASTRSTGQREEGDAGIAFVAVDDGSVSWRFKPLGSAWPFVMITSPPDRRLAIARADHGFDEIRASVWCDAPIDMAEVRVDDGAWLAMDIEAGGVLRRQVPGLDGPCRISVRVRAADGRSGEDSVDFDLTDGERHASGSDAGRIGAWPERHLLDTQLGPNRNGRKW